MINFLETVNLEDHAGKGIYWWPMVQDKNNTIPQEEKVVEIKNETVSEQPNSITEESLGDLAQESDDAEYEIREDAPVENTILF